MIIDQLLASADQSAWMLRVAVDEAASKFNTEVGFDERRVDVMAARSQIGGETVNVLGRRKRIPRSDTARLCGRAGAATRHRSAGGLGA